MLEKITVGEKNLDSYRPMVTVGAQLLDEVIALGKELQGVRLCHINSTPYGGGVAELLYSCIPLLRSVGVMAEWRIITADQPFFTVTKDFHNALQGAESNLSDEGREVYLECNRGNARDFAANYDIIIVVPPEKCKLSV
jgi:trehalose synthase